MSALIFRIGFDIIRSYAATRTRRNSDRAARINERLMFAMKRSVKVFAAIRRIEDLTVVRAVRNGLIHIIPVLIIGAFSLILQTFPVDAYQTFISSFLDGALLKLFETVYNATFGALSVYMTFSISRSFISGSFPKSHKNCRIV